MELCCVLRGVANIQNPHDKFFKAMLSIPGAAEEFIRFFLPKEYLEILDLKTLDL